VREREALAVLSATVLLASVRADALLEAAIIALAFHLGSLGEVAPASLPRCTVLFLLLFLLVLVLLFLVAVRVSRRITAAWLLIVGRELVRVMRRGRFGGHLLPLAVAITAPFGREREALAVLPAAVLLATVGADPRLTGAVIALVRHLGPLVEVAPTDLPGSAVLRRLPAAHEVAVRGHFHHLGTSLLHLADLRGALRSRGKRHARQGNEGDLRE